MGKLSVFNFISLDGYYKGMNEDISWNRHGQEENEFSADNLKSGSILLFGRVTYDMMASFWPTPQAIKNMPEVATGMNSAEKIVFSRTMKTAAWEHTRVINENITEEIKKLKQSAGKDMTLLGSGNILNQFADAGLIDIYQFMINPVALGNGTPIFKNITHQLDLELTNTKIFKSGAVLLTYKPKKK